MALKPQAAALLLGAVLEAAQYRGEPYLEVVVEVVSSTACTAGPSPARSTCSRAPGTATVSLIIALLLDAPKRASTL